MPSSPTAASAARRPIGRAAQETAPEREIFLHRQRRLQRVQMAEIVRLLADGELRVAAFERDPAARQRHQPGDQRAAARICRPRWVRSPASASPAATLKPKPDKTSRPPRIQARSDATKPHRQAFRRPIRASPAVRGRPRKTGHFLSVLLTSVDFLEPRKKRPYKPGRSALTSSNPRAVATGDPGADR